MLPTIGVMILLFFFVLYLLKKLLKRQFDRKKPDIPLECRTSLMNRWEIELFDKIAKAVTPAHVFPQVAMSAFIKTLNAKGKGRSVFAQKYVDFLICETKTFKPIYIIELDGSSHRSQKAQERDKARDKMLFNAGINVQRYRSSSVPMETLKSDYMHHTNKKTFCKSRLLPRWSPHK